MRAVKGVEREEEEVREERREGRKEGRGRVGEGIWISQRRERKSSCSD